MGPRPDWRPAKLPYHVADDRIVFTYEPDGWPLAVLTGREFLDGYGFFLEHVIVFPGAPRGTILKLVNAGVEAAREREYRVLQTFIHDQHPQRDGLQKLALKLGFEGIDHCASNGTIWERRLRG